MTNELLLKESILRYISVEVSDESQPFTSPLLGDTDPRIQEMDQAQPFPRPPSLRSSIDVIDACECGRWEGGAVARQSIHNSPMAAWPIPSLSPALPPQPACPSPPAISGL